MSAARGAISSAAKARTVSRNMSIVSPRSKFNPEVMAGRSLAQRLGPFAVAALSASRHSDRTLATAPDSRAASIVAHRVQERLRLGLALEDVGAHGPAEHLPELHPHEGTRRVAGDAGVEGVLQRAGHLGIGTRHVRVEVEGVVVYHHGHAPADGPGTASRPRHGSPSRFPGGGRAAPRN